MCDEKGKIIDGDQIIAMLARRWKIKKILKGGVIGTLMSNYGLENFLRKEKIRFLSYDSPIILIFGSVPDFLINNLPYPFINLFAFLIAFLHLVLLITFLFFTIMFSNICGKGLKTLSN